MIEESIEGNDPLMTPARKHNNKGPTRPNQIKLRKNTQPDNTHPKTLLPKKTDSPEISNKKKVTGMGQKYQENIQKFDENTAIEAEKLRVSHVDLNKEMEQQFVELQMDNQSNNSQEERSMNDSNLHIYQPNGLSPVREGRNAGYVESNEKYFNHLKSHRQEERRPFSPPFRGVQPTQETDSEEQKSATPFKEQASTKGTTSQSEFQQRMNIVQVQKADLIHDSLDEVPKHLSHILQESADKEGISQKGDKMKVMNEDGNMLEVIYDPVLKCYYEPTQNAYY